MSVILPPSIEALVYVVTLMGPAAKHVPQPSLGERM